MNKYFTEVTSFSKILAGLLFIILPFIGFYLGILYSQNTRVKEVNNDYHENEEVTETIENNKEEIININDITWTINRDIYTEDLPIYGGSSDFILSFEYPDTWTVNKTLFGSNLGTCFEYSIDSPEEVVTFLVERYCGSWAPEYSELPEEYSVIRKLTNQGNDSHTSYIIRYLNSDTGTYFYRDVSSNNTEAIEEYDLVEDAVTLSSGSYDFYFYPVRVNVMIDSDTDNIDYYLEITDEIVKSLSLALAE